MNNSKNQKPFLKLLLAVFFALSNLGPQAAHALGDPSVKAPSEDTIALQVQQTQSIEEAKLAIEQAHKSIFSYRTTLRQLYKNLYSDWDRETQEKAIESMKELILDEQRRISLLEAKIQQLQPVEEE